MKTAEIERWLRQASVPQVARVQAAADDARMHWAAEGFHALDVTVAYAAAAEVAIIAEWGLVPLGLV